MMCRTLWYYVDLGLGLMPAGVDAGIIAESDGWRDLSQPGFQRGTLMALLSPGDRVLVRFSGLRSGCPNVTRLAERICQNGGGCVPGTGRAYLPVPGWDIIVKDGIRFSVVPAIGNDDPIPQ